MVPRQSPNEVLTIRPPTEQLEFDWRRNYMPDRLTSLLLKLYPEECRQSSAPPPA